MAAHKLGQKSIFWDPEFNPNGLAPKGHKNTIYKPDSDTGSGRGGVQALAIPLPKDPPPKFFKFYKAQSAVIEKDESLQIDTSNTMIPQSVLLKRGRSHSVRSAKKAKVESGNGKDS